MFADIFANILFPPACVACGARIAHGVVCEACLATVELNPALMCGECHKWLVGVESPCHPDFPFVLGGASRYENPVLQSLIHQLKFRSISRAADPLGDLLVDYVRRIQRRDSSFDLTGGEFTVIPIPLSRRRARVRGYNQAELIARRFATEMSLPLDTTTLVRARYTKPQSDILDVAARRENMRGVFAVADRALADGSTVNALRGRPIILVDDVSTTGSTFHEAATALKIHGAGKIITLAVAKTM